MNERIFMMKLSVVVAVAAKDTKEAFSLADDRMARDAISDSPYVDVELLQEAQCIADLIPHGWDEMCIPYGNTDGNTRLSEILPEN